MLTDRVRLGVATKVETKSAQTGQARKQHRYRPRRTTDDRVRSALLSLAEGQGCLLSHAEIPWNSITFTGTRHEVTLCFTGNAATQVGERFIADLPEHEFTIPGHLVAEATIREVDHRFGVDERLVVMAVLLLLEEA